MKGLVAKQDTGTVYLMVKYHCICEVSKKPREGFDPITVPDMSTGEEITKYIRRYDLEGMITNIEWRDTKQQYETRFRSWRIHVDAAGTPVVLEIPWGSNPSDRFMKTAENINFSKPVEFRVWKDGKGKTDKTAFAIFQDGMNVPAKYRRGEMGDCPEATEEVDGWDFGPQLRYLHGQMMNMVVPRVQAAAAMGRPQEPEEADPFADEQPSSSDTGVKARAVSASGLSSENDGSDDDIPF